MANSTPDERHAQRVIESGKGSGNAAEVEARRVAVLRHKYRNGLTQAEIARLLGVHQSQISRDLKWWQSQWKTARKHPSRYVDELAASFDQIYDAAAQARFDPVDATTGARVGPARTAFEINQCLRTMIAARLAKARILIEAGRISPSMDQDDADAKAERLSAGDVRRLAESVRKQLGGTTEVIEDDLTPVGERKFLEGDAIVDAETIEGDE